VLTEVAYAVLVGLATMTAETMYRLYPTWRTFFMMLPVSFLIALGIFGMLRHAPTFLGAYLMFTVFRWGLRLLSVKYLVKEPLHLVSFVAVGLVVAAAILERFWGGG